jgi:hypothetical protein
LRQGTLQQFLRADITARFQISEAHCIVTNIFFIAQHDDTLLFVID